MPGHIYRMGLFTLITMRELVHCGGVEFLWGLGEPLPLSPISPFILFLPFSCFSLHRFVSIPYGIYQ